MILNHEYKNECDILRLLLNEFERMCERYPKEHKEEISTIEAQDASEYHAPRYIPSLKEWLTSSILIHVQGLLDFRLPRIVSHLAKNTGVRITPFNQKWKGGNVLFWVKHVLKNELKSNFDFSRGPYQKLRDFYDIRNDQVHHGGYLSAEEKRVRVNKLKGVHISKYTDLYDVDFSYCKSLIDDVEAFLTEVEKNISNK